MSKSITYAALCDNKVKGDIECQVILKDHTEDHFQKTLIFKFLG